MTAAIPKPCAKYPACRNTTTSRYCELCAPKVQRQYDAERANDPIRKMYHTPTWRRTRMDVLIRDPICKMCSHAASAEVDHIIAARQFGGDFYDMDNLQGLCKPCHSEKTATEGGWAGNNRI